MREKIAQGAEAILWRDGNELIKERVKKGYRLAKLDELLRKRRTAHEADLLNSARRAGVCTPQVIDASGSTLKIGWIEGKRVKETVDDENCETIAKRIGAAIGKLHSYDIIHGDLTTSNMIIRRDTNSVTNSHTNSSPSADQDICFIDFGLGFNSPKAEDKAVDLYLLYHAIESTHWQILDKMWSAVLAGYRETFSQAEKVIKTLAAIEKRGRYKER